MDSKEPFNPIYRIHVRTKDLDRNSAVMLAEQTLPEYKIAFVLAGYKED